MIDHDITYSYEQILNQINKIFQDYNVFNF